MSRAEIDALAARQLARLQGPPFRPADAYLLVGALAVAGLCKLLHVGMAGWWLLFLALVVVETAALALDLPRAEMQSDLRAIALTGNPDVFFSALGESGPPERRHPGFAGARKNRPACRCHARPPARPAPTPTPSREDRYPTSGDYVTVGF